MAETQRLNVVFLINDNPPKKVILLKRASNKTFAPNFYTGIGGKIGDLPNFKNETPLESAYRELDEETEGEITRDNITLHEFARCIYESGPKLYYFWGKYSKNSLPNISPDDGTLYWVNTKELLQKDLIPTTLEVCKEWAKRKFRTDKPFTVYLRETGKERTVRLVKILGIENGLQNEK